MKATKRAYSVTTGEVSATFFFIAMILLTIGLVQVIKISNLIAPVNPFLSGGLNLGVSLIGIAAFFYFLSVIIPNWAITKYNLNILIDRITNPDFIGWVRFTRDKGIQFHTVEVDSHGRTKGLVNDKKADVINSGECTLTCSNGNKLIIVNDFLSHNKNLKDCVGWSLVKKHFGFLGYDVHRRAVSMGKTIMKDEQTDNKDSVVDMT